MDALDGNAIAGALFDLFGREMTVEAGTCLHCGASAQIALLRVFAKAPGTVARCPSCGNVVMVIVDVRDDTRLDMRWFELRGG